MVGELEAEVLMALQAVGPAPARDIRARLSNRGTRVAYTTVATVLSRLFEKGMVKRKRETCRGGERYVYEAADFEKRYLKGVLQGIVSLFGPAGVVHLSEELANLNPAEERELRRRLGL